MLNGSYIIFDYSDFALESNFIIYYNEFRSEFYGEARIKNIPEMNYTFDSDSLLELEEFEECQWREHEIGESTGTTFVALHLQCGGSGT